MAAGTPLLFTFIKDFLMLEQLNIFFFKKGILFVAGNHM